METRRGEAQDKPAENEPGEPGAEGGSGTEDAQKLPGEPTDDDSAAGDTDQHSTG